MSALWLLAALASAPTPSPSPVPPPSTSPPPSPEPPRFDETRVDALTAMAARLRTHVAYVDVTVDRPRDQPLAEDERDGFGVAWGPTRVVCLSFLVEEAKRVVVAGPRGQADARVILRDVERRVAVLETSRPIAELGLAPVFLAPPASRAVSSGVFALVGTSPEGHVLLGRVLDDGSLPELEGHPRVSLSLAQGTPFFDERARFVGYARAVAWDRDTALIVTPEHVRAAASATTAAARPTPSPTKPWWAR